MSQRGSGFCSVGQRETDNYAVRDGRHCYCTICVCPRVCVCVCVQADASSVIFYLFWSDTICLYSLIRNECFHARYQSGMMFLKPFNPLFTPATAQTHSLARKPDVRRTSPLDPSEKGHALRVLHASRTAEMHVLQDPSWKTPIWMVFWGKEQHAVGWI